MYTVSTKFACLECYIFMAAMRTAQSRTENDVRTLCASRIPPLPCSVVGHLQAISIVLQTTEAVNWMSRPMQACYTIKLLWSVRR
jgi:hypothetical protein